MVPIRITLFTDNQYGGTGVHTSGLADYLALAGDQVQVVAALVPAWPASGPTIFPQHAPTAYLGPAAGRTERPGFLELRHALKATAPDVVYFGKGGPGSGNLAMHLALASTAPLVVFEHDAPPRPGVFPPPVAWRGWRPSLGLHWRLTFLRMRLRDRLTARILTNSASTQQKLQQFYGGVTDEVVPLGVDLQRFRPTAPLCPPAAIGIRIGLVGRADVEMKGLDLAFDAIRQVGERGLPVAEVIFPVESADTARIAALAEAHGATPWLRFIPLVATDDLAALYSSMDGLLVASRFEGGPFTMLEAMACGTPVIATPVGLVPQVIEDGRNGIRVAATESVPALVEGLQRFAALSPAERERMGLAARETIVRHHDAQEHFARLREILHEVARQ